MEETKEKVDLQTITITNPHDQTRQAVLNIWFIGKDIVIGGIGWMEYYDYEDSKNLDKALESVKSQTVTQKQTENQK